MPIQNFVFTGINNYEYTEETKAAAEKVVEPIKQTIGEALKEIKVTDSSKAEFAVMEPKVSETAKTTTG